MTTECSTVLLRYCIYKYVCVFFFEWYECGKSIKVWYDSLSNLCVCPLQAPAKFNSLALSRGLDSHSMSKSQQWGYCTHPTHPINTIDSHSLQQSTLTKQYPSAPVNTYLSPFFIDQHQSTHFFFTSQRQFSAKQDRSTPFSPMNSNVFTGNASWLHIASSRNYYYYR